MRLEFNILWVEDQKKGVKAQRDRISILLRKEGFKLQTEFAASVEDARNLLSTDIYGDHIDLVLMDYDLGKGPDGSVGISTVRKLFPFKDIVFYSGKGVKALQTRVTKGKFQGVFCSSRLDLPNTAFGVFQTLVKKVLDIDHSRGIVMGATSEIDYFINQSLLNAFSQDSDQLRKDALKAVSDQVAKVRCTFEDEEKKVLAATELSELMSLHHVFSSAHRIELLRKVLKKRGTHLDEEKQMISYITDTVPRRNVLAHLRVERKGFARKLFNKKGIEVTIDDMRDLRIALLEHHELFEKVATSLLPG